MFSRHTETLARGGEDADPTAALQQEGRELCDSRDQMLAIVEHKERRPVTEELDDGVQSRPMILRSGFDGSAPLQIESLGELDR